MGELNSRTPEKIKQSIRICAILDENHDCTHCPRFPDEYTDCSNALLLDAVAYIEHLEAQIPKWISVEERLPTEEDAPGDGRVLCVISKAAGSLAGERRAYHWEMVANHPTWFAHWMPLPEPPEGGE